ncbi:MAG: 30S ribosomal protein S6 [Hyphomicrobiales bacterium]
MREYELTVVYDLAVTESGGADASIELLTTAVESRGGKVLRTDHWGRRRMAYPINRALDADYIVSRIEIDPAKVRDLEDGFRIDERVYRHLIVRADELPPPPPPREPRRQPAEVQQATSDTTATRPAAAPVAEATPAVAESPATQADAAAMGAAGESPAPVPAQNAPEPGSAPASGTIAETDATA